MSETLPPEPVSLLPNLLAHLFVLRKCLLQSLLVVAIIFLSLCPFANELYHLLALPLLTHLPHQSSMIAIGIAAPLLIPLKFSLVLTVFIAIPFLLYQIWKFVTPGLYRQERRWIWLVLFFSSVLFYLGVAFAYFIVCPLLFSFMTKTTPVGVNFMPDMSQFLDFILHFLFAFGIGFEVPIVMLLLVRLRITTLASLTAKRRYFIVLAFIIGMLLTPPDVLSQTLLAIPLCLLYEAGLLAARFCG